MFKVYTQLYASQREHHFAAISRLFLALYSKGSALQNLLSRICTPQLTFRCSDPTRSVSLSLVVVWEGLVVTCAARPIPPEAVSNGKKSKNYIEYYQLWKNVRILYWSLVIEPVAHHASELTRGRC